MNEILFRNNEQYLGREFFFKEEIVQVIGPSNEVYNFRVRIVGDPAASPARRRLINLEELSLGNNDLTGPLPAEWGDLARLKGLHLYGNNLSGPLPLGLTGMFRLRVLDLSNTALCVPANDAFRIWLLDIERHGVQYGCPAT